MSKAKPAPVPPIPTVNGNQNLSSSTPDLSEDSQILCSFYAIVHSYSSEEKKWQQITSGFAQITFADKGGDDLKARYKIVVTEKNQKILEYVIRPSTRSNYKDTFVKWQDDTATFGARFTKASSAEEFQNRIAALVMDVSPYAKVIKKKKSTSSDEGCIDERRPSSEFINGVPLPSRPEELTVIYGSATIEKTSKKNDKQNKVVINVYLPNGESSMYNLEGQMPIEDLFSKVCREENLKETFHTMQYLSSKGGTLSMDGKVSDLRSYELRFVDKREQRRSVNMDSKLKVQEQEKMKNKSTKRRSLFFFKSPTKESSVKESRQQDEVNFQIDPNNPIVRTFLEMANIHEETIQALIDQRKHELKDPSIRAIVNEFVIERGGQKYLRQIRDTKLSQQILDDISELSSKITAKSFSPTHVASPSRSISEEGSSNYSQRNNQHHQLRRAASEDTLSPKHSVQVDFHASTLPRKPPKPQKRRAPPPPKPDGMKPSRSLETLDKLDEEDGTYEKIPRQIKKLDDDQASVGSATTPRTKRRAPAPPGQSVLKSSLSPTPSNYSIRTVSTAFSSPASTAIPTPVCVSPEVEDVNNNELQSDVVRPTNLPLNRSISQDSQSSVEKERLKAKSSVSSSSSNEFVSTNSEPAKELSVKSEPTKEPLARIESIGETSTEPMDQSELIDIILKPPPMFVAPPPPMSPPPDEEVTTPVGPLSGKTLKGIWPMEDPSKNEPSSEDMVGKSAKDAEMEIVEDNELVSENIEQELKSDDFEKYLSPTGNPAVLDCNNTLTFSPAVSPSCEPKKLQEPFLYSVIDPEPKESLHITEIPEEFQDDKTTNKYSADELKTSMHSVKPTREIPSDPEKPYVQPSITENANVLNTLAAALKVGDDDASNDSLNETVQSAETKEIEKSTDLSLPKARKKLVVSPELLAESDEESKTKVTASLNLEDEFTLKDIKPLKEPTKQDNKLTDQEEMDVNAEKVNSFEENKVDKIEANTEKTSASKDDENPQVAPVQLPVTAPTSAGSNASIELLQKQLLEMSQQIQSLQQSPGPHQQQQQQQQFLQQLLQQQMLQLIQQQQQMMFQQQQQQPIQQPIVIRGPQLAKNAVESSAGEVEQKPAIVTQVEFPEENKKEAVSSIALDGAAKEDMKPRDASSSPTDSEESLGTGQAEPAGQAVGIEKPPTPAPPSVALDAQQSSKGIGAQQTPEKDASIKSSVDPIKVKSDADQTSSVNINNTKPEKPPRQLPIVPRKISGSYVTSAQNCPPSGLYARIQQMSKGKGTQVPPKPAEKPKELQMTNSVKKPEIENTNKVTDQPDQSKQNRTIPVQMQDEVKSTSKIDSSPEIVEPKSEQPSKSSPVNVKELNVDLLSERPKPGVPEISDDSKSDKDGFKPPTLTSTGTAHENITKTCDTAVSEKVPVKPDNVVTTDQKMVNGIIDKSSNVLVEKNSNASTEISKSENVKPVISSDASSETEMKLIDAVDLRSTSDSSSKETEGVQAFSGSSTQSRPFMSGPTPFAGFRSFGPQAYRRQMYLPGFKPQSRIMQPPTSVEPKKELDRKETEKQSLPKDSVVPQPKPPVKATQPPKLDTDPDNSVQPINDSSQKISGTVDIAAGSNRKPSRIENPPEETKVQASQQKKPTTDSLTTNASSSSKAVDETKVQSTKQDEPKLFTDILEPTSAPPQITPDTKPVENRSEGQKNQEPPVSASSTTNEEYDLKESVSDRIKKFRSTSSSSTTTSSAPKPPFIMSGFSNRSAEISSGSVSSKVLNKPISHKPKKERLVSFTEEQKKPKTKTEPKTVEPADDKNRSISIGKAPPAIRPKPSRSDSVTKEEPVKDIQQENLVQNKNKFGDNVVAKDVQPAAASGKSGGVYSTYSSLRSVEDKDKNRETVTVRKIGGLRIGYARDTPKVVGKDSR